MSDICSKHGPYSVLCKMCDFETPTPPQGDARVTVPRETLELCRRVIDNFMGDSDLPEDDSDEMRAMQALAVVLSAAPQTHSTDDEARTLDLAQFLYVEFWKRNKHPDLTPWEKQVTAIREMWIAIARSAISRIPSEEATEEEITEFIRSPRHPCRCFQCMYATLRAEGYAITRTPGGQT